MKLTLSAGTEHTSENIVVIASPSHRRAVADLSTIPPDHGPMPEADSDALILLAFYAKIRKNKEPSSRRPRLRLNPESNRKRRVINVVMRRITKISQW